MPASEDLLSDDHADVGRLLDDAAQKMERGNAIEALKALDLFWARLAMHIRAEHLHLFPAVLKINSETTFLKYSNAFVSITIFLCTSWRIR